ncbi:transcriptional regulator SUPERMAN-like [Rutidosis leptorrhynchoides]|uniref:transcriptional regulator SUPERMAN-like n=1 Tax=Rutidosis leptorrhynchoides TaxID=125765 RepID=UPI003A9941A7
MDHHKFKSKWESNHHNLTYDHKEYYGSYQGFSWPQRNFMCNFCNKEYKSAQALGGHMNVHRRDRARLRLSSPPLDQHHSNSNSYNPNPIPNNLHCVSPPSPVRYQPYKTYHSSLFPLVNTNNVAEYEPHKLSLQFACSGIDFLGCMKKSTVMMEVEEENGIRVSKKNENFKMEMEEGLFKDEKIQLDLDLELRLGRS